jgi:tetratricopeptide (TPR) repeat protein
VTLLIYALAGTAAAQAPATSPGQGPNQKPATAAATDALAHARMLLDSDNLAEAFSLVKAYLQKHPQTPDAHALMGLILYRQRQPRASMAEYLKASESADLSAFDLRIFALDCAAIPDLPEAEKWLLRSIEKDDRDAATWEALGHVRFSSQQYEAAIESLEHALQLVPRTVSAESLIGLANERLARPDVAETAYRTAIQWQAGRKEKDAVPLVGLGRVLLGNNQPEEAIPWLQQAAKIPPPSSEVHELLGLAYSKTARETEAAKELETAVRLQPDSARLHLMLGRTYRSLGAKEKADGELAQYAKLKGNGVQ